jgi:hypothetical protein
MSRSGYVDDMDDQWASVRWRGAVASALNGFRGQAALIVLRDALDSMPAKRLISGELITADGEVCTMGRLAQAAGCNVADVDPYDAEQVAAALGLSEAMVKEIAYVNDDYWNETPEHRWTRMRAWVESHIKRRGSPA